jgi:PAS domain S-box-containing protein
MLWQLSPSVLAEAGTALGILIIAVYFPWRDVSRRANLIGSSLLVIAALWILTHALEIGIPVASTKAYLMGLQLIWGLIAITLWLMYIIHYTATRKWQSGRIYALFGFIPLLAILAVATNHSYGLMWTAPGLDVRAPYLPLKPAYGLAYWACMAYMGALIASGSLLILRKVVQRNDFRRWEPWTLILAAIIPLFVAFLEVTGFAPSAHLTVGITPFFSSVGSIILAWSLPRFHMQKVIPLARHTVFEQIGDGVVVLNMQNRVVDLNPAAERLAGTTSSEALGLPVEHLWSNWPSQLALPGPASTVFEEWTLAHAGEQRTYSLHTYTIADHDNRSLNKVVLLIDTTERKRSKEELEQNYQAQTALNKLMHLSLETSSQPEVFDCALDLLTSLSWLTLEKKGAIFLVEDDPQTLVMKAEHGLSAPLLGTCARVPFGHCMCGRAALSGKIEFADRLDERHEVRYQGISPHGHYCVPLVSAGKVLGVINLYVKEGHHRNEKEEEFLHTVAGMLAGIIERKRVEEEITQSHAQLERSFEAIVKTISAAVEIRDPYTAGHQQRVAQLARGIAQEMGLPGKRVDEIFTAAIIHDIGKIQVPSEILSKPGKLSEPELSLIKAHSQVGHDILKNAAFPYSLSQWVLEHHERMNGSGYPNGLTAGQISLEGKILAVADVVEAMASHRPYRPSLGIEKALTEISGQKGVLYDAVVTDTCLKLFKEKGFKFDGTAS